MQINHRVSYYNKIYYIIQDQPITENKDMLDSNNRVYKIQKIIIKADDIIKFLDLSLDSFYRQGFNRVISVMVHEQIIFLVIA